MPEPFRFFVDVLRPCCSQQGRIGVRSARVSSSWLLRAVPVLAFFVVLMTSEPVAAQVLRESDQASLVDGALQLSEGTPKRGADFYNYDKQYLSYWLSAPPAEVAGEAAVGPGAVVSRAMRVIGWVNLMSGSVALAGFWMLWAVGLRRAAAGKVVSALVFTFCPLVMLCAAPASSATFSAGFLLALIAVLSLRGKRLRLLRPLLAPLLVFAAVAARADAILCLPMLCWAYFRGRSWRQFRGEVLFWAMGVAAVAALILGRYLVDDATTTFYDVFLNGKVFAAYWIFGLGSCGLWWLLQMVVIPLLTRHRFYWLGAAFLLLPLVFYSWQLYSPRHLMTTAVVALAGGFLWKGRAVYRLVRRRFPWTTKAILTVVLVVTLVPLVAGIFLPNPKSPRLTVFRATEFPTADGLWPMGATLSFLSRWRDADRIAIDHNQRVWQAAMVSDFSAVPAVDPVPVLETDMRAYLLLSLRLQGREGKVVTWQEFRDGDPTIPEVFVDERSLRVAAGMPTLSELEKLGIGAQLASAPLVGVILLSREDKKIDSDLRLRLLVATEFGGDEFSDIPTPMDEDAWQHALRKGAHSKVFSSAAQFSVNGRAAEPRGEWWLLRVTSKEIDEAGGRFAITGGDPAKVWVWTAVLPDYMSRAALRAGD